MLGKKILLGFWEFWGQLSFTIWAHLNWLRHIFKFESTPSRIIEKKKKVSISSLDSWNDLYILNIVYLFIFKDVR